MRLSPHRERGVGHQIRYTKKISNMKGSGVVNYFREVGDKFIEKTLRSRPKILNDLIENEGSQIITSVKVCRRPLSKVFERVLNLLTFGEMAKEMERLGYDNLFHLYLVVFLENGTIYALEKNERVNVIVGEVEGGECEEQYNIKPITLETFITNAEDKKIDGFYQYDSFRNNCQTWVFNILNSNGISQFNSFIVQNVSSIAPEYIKNIAKGITNIAGIIDYTMRGGGDENEDYYEGD